MTTMLHGRRRIDLLAVLFTAFLGLVLYRLWKIQISEHDRWSRRQVEQVERALGFAPPRGAITDRAGRPLALSIEVHSLAADPARIEDPSSVAAHLAPILALDADEIEGRLERTGRFVWLARRLSAETAEKIRALAVPGLFFRTEYVRTYPHGTTAAHLVGFAGWDGVGLEGIERALDAELRGSDAERAIPRDAFGRPIPTPGDVGWANDGEDVTLTIDLLIQTAAEAALDEALEVYHARSASAVVLDPATGEVLALASRPSYDPNRFFEVDPARHRNGAVEHAFEPGSTFKPFVLAAALEGGFVPRTATYECTGSIRLYGFDIRCHDKHGRVDLTKLIAQSCNVGAIHVARAMPEARLYETFIDLGFGAPTGIGLPGEAAGVLRPPSAWSGLSAAMLGIGQEISATPLQLAHAAAILAEDGVERPLRIVKRVGGEEVTPDRPPRRVLSAATAEELHKILRSTVEDGTGRLARIPGVAVAGKTGTAQVSKPGLGYLEGKYNAVFWGFAPAEAPRLVVVVVVEEPDPKVGYYGGDVAAPVFARIVREGLRVLGELPPEAVASEEPSTSPAPEARRIEASARPLPPVEVGPKGVRVPDLTGLPLHRVHELLSEYALRVTATGEGVVASQAPPPGAWLPPGGEVRLALGDAAETRGLSDFVRNPAL